ncbi:hypothetical protein GCM10011349_44560 [Novosphingobium indicum]|uniref:Uncharacterized protein n=1 Tax=Novosphingobium indicum TaxID=462949 RepID=A0ABQ2K287_9SPHN|nr:hypothetical protein GCM10011349_44560 [Novosphingobium indicum]
MARLGSRMRRTSRYTLGGLPHPAVGILRMAGASFPDCIANRPQRSGAFGMVAIWTGVKRGIYLYDGKDA